MRPASLVPLFLLDAAVPIHGRWLHSPHCSQGAVSRMEAAAQEVPKPLRHRELRRKLNPHLHETIHAVRTGL